MSRFDLPVEGVTLRFVGKRGKAESRFDDRSGEGGPMFWGRGLVALRFIEGLP